MRHRSATPPSPFALLLGDAGLAPNLVTDANGFSDTVQRVFEHFKSADHIGKLGAFANVATPQKCNDVAVAGMAALPQLHNRDLEP